jgi:MoxR-like ATPase
MDPVLVAGMRDVLALLREHWLRQRDRGRDELGDPRLIAQSEGAGLLEELVRDWLAADHAARWPAVPAGEGGLARLARAFGLDGFEYTAVLLALLVEVDARAGRLIALINDHYAATRPTLGLVAGLAGSGLDPALLARQDRPAFRDGLLELEGDGPIVGRAFRLDPDVARRLLADDPRHAEQRRLGDLVIDPVVRRVVELWIDRQRAGVRVPLLVAGRPGAGRRTVARAASAELASDVLELELRTGELEADLRRARREARWHDAALVLRVAADVEWRQIWTALRGWQLPVAVIVVPEVIDAAIQSAAPEPLLARIEDLEPAVRSELWRRLLPRDVALEDAALHGLAQRFRFGPRRIAQAIRRAALDGTIDAAGLARACRELGSAAVGGLAQQLSLPYRREDLVVRASVMAELELAMSWARHRHHVLETWRFGRRVASGRGLTMLFAGPPGTGKTMAVQVLAHELELDLFRVDLSRLMSKYIGDTEKNLAQLFDEARASGAMLFFDEADALFGKRTEVKDSHDRYANLEIGYLLQRMEDHDGVTVLATNRVQDMDAAFVRRFHIQAEFPMPNEAERIRIWDGMIPKEAARAPDLDLARLAHDFSISGGDIRNVVLASAFFAASEGDAIGRAHVLKAMRRELRKTGRIVDEQLLR